MIISIILLRVFVIFTTFY